MATPYYRRILRPAVENVNERWLQTWLDKYVVKYDEDGETVTLPGSLVVSSIVVEGWTAVSSFSNSWVNFGSPYMVTQYRKTPDGTVHIQGLVKSGTVGASVFTLPAGYRPSATLLFATITDTGVGRLDVRADGVVIANTGGNTFYSVNCSFST